MLDFNEDAKLTFALSVRSIKTPIDLGCFHFHNSCPLMKAVVRFSARIHKINWFCPKNQEIVVQLNYINEWYFSNETINSLINSSYILWLWHFLYFDKVINVANYIHTSPLTKMQLWHFNSIKWYHQFHLTNS